MRLHLIAALVVTSAFTGTLGCASGGGAQVVTTTTPHGSTGQGRAGFAEGAPREPLSWNDFNAQTFARAKAERKFIVLDGSAEWCHWCHVMEATTYHDPDVSKILHERFVAIKVDIDSRPDLEERYGDYGWPATVIFSPDAEELGKYRGYIAPERFVEILREVVSSGADKPQAATQAVALTGPQGPAPKTPLAEEQLAWIERLVDVELDELYDEKLGGWGMTQKAAIAWDNTWCLELARRGSQKAKEQALFTLDQQRKIIDPVWGGIYQYSTNGDWDHPHFEKLMPFNAGALDNYADAYKLTKDKKWLDVARQMQGYLEGFMMSPEGGFYVTQDADLNAHDPSKPFMSGHDYYAMDDAHRRAAGIPRVDAHEYAKDNGLAIGAYARLYEGTGDARVLATAKRAADRILTTHATPRGGVTHDAIPAAAPAGAAGGAGAAADGAPSPSRILHLADNAAFGWGLMRLYEASKDAKYLEAATKMADFMVKELADEEGGGFFAATRDPDAVGIFQARRKPFEENVMAARFLAALARATPDGAARETYRRGIDRTLRAISTPDEIKARGRMIGDYLLALEETKGVRGAAAPTTAAPATAAPATAAPATAAPATGATRPPAKAEPKKATKPK